MLLAKIPSEVLFAAALGLLTLLLLRLSLRRFRRTQDDTLIKRLPRPDSSLSQGSLYAPDDVARWDVYMQERSRELSAQLDSKMLALEHLTVSAARQTERLEKVIAEARGLKIDPATGDRRS